MGKSAAEGAIDKAAAERAIAQFLAALGCPAVGERAHTPRLVVQAWTDDLLAGYAADPVAILRASSIDQAPSRMAVRDEKEWVVLRDLDVVTMCPHHLLPAHGSADVVYRPGARLVGFGAVARALHALARRLTLQETVGRELVTLLMSELGAEGVLCRLRLRHSCMVARGVRQHRAEVETLAFGGCFADGSAAGQAALSGLGR